MSARWGKYRRDFFDAAGFYRDGVSDEQLASIQNAMNPHVTGAFGERRVPRPQVAGGELAADLRTVMQQVSEQLAALRTFGAESIAGPLQTTFGDVQDVVSAASDRAMISDVLFQENDRLASEVVSVRDELVRVLRVSSEQLDEVRDNHRQQTRLLEEDRSLGWEVVEQLRLRIKDEARYGRLRRDAGSRFIREATAAAREKLGMS